MTENNLKKRELLAKIIEDAFRRTLKKGFYGVIAFEVSIDDGAIQEIEKKETQKYRNN